VRLNAIIRLNDYWDLHHKPMPMRVFSGLYARPIHRLGGDFYRDLIGHPDFIAVIFMIHHERGNRFVIPRPVWEAMSLEAQTELLAMVPGRRNRGRPFEKIPPPDHPIRRRVRHRSGSEVSVDDPPSSAGSVPQPIAGIDDGSEALSIDQLLKRQV
jgi:hypothetical protein